MRTSKAAAIFSVLGTLGLLAAHPAPAADEGVRLEAGDPSIDGSFLKPYTNRWTFSIQKPGSEPVTAGVWSDRMETATSSGRPALKRTQVAEYKNGIRLTFVNVFDPKTMSSLTFDYERSDTGETRHLEVHDRSVQFQRSPGTGGEAAQNYVATVDRRVLDYYDGLYGILLDSLPLREGFEANLAAFDTDRAAIDWVRVKVIGKEKIAVGTDRLAETWVVHVETQRYDSSTWWLTREAPYVIKAVLVMPKSEGGATITYTMA